MKIRTSRVDYSKQQQYEINSPRKPSLRLRLRTPCAARHRSVELDLERALPPTSYVPRVLIRVRNDGRGSERSGVGVVDGGLVAHGAPALEVEPVHEAARVVCDSDASSANLQQKRVRGMKRTLVAAGETAARLRRLARFAVVVALGAL